MNKIKLTALISTVAFLFVIGLPMASKAAAIKTTKKAATKKTTEGGQMQLKGYEGRIGDWLFNGFTRFKVTSVTFPSTGPRGEMPEEGKRWVLIAVELKNATGGTKVYGDGQHAITLVDKEGNTIQETYMVKKDNWNETDDGRDLLPAAGMKGIYAIAVPNNFIPVRLVFDPYGGEKVFRVNFPELAEKAKATAPKVKATPAPAKEKEEGEAAPELPSLPETPSLPMGE